MSQSALAAAGSSRGQPRLRVCEGGRWKRGSVGTRRGMCEGTSSSAASAVGSATAAPSSRHVDFSFVRNTGCVVLYHVLCYYECV